MALTTAVVVGEARHWMLEVAIILILFRRTRLTSWRARPSGRPGSVAWLSPRPSWSVSQALETRGGNHFDFVQEYTINQLVGAAFGAAGQRCMALTTAVVVGEARHWIPEVAEKAAKLKLSAGMHYVHNFHP
jgi:hypothetical protein